MYRKAISIIILANLFSVVFYSCCEDRYQVLPDQYETSFSLYVEEDRVITTDSLTGPFIYGLAAEVEHLVTNDLGAIMTNSAYAISCTETYLNSFLFSSASVSLDKSIKVNGQVFEAGENLFDLDEMFTADILNAQVGESHIRIWFRESMLARSEFEEGDYEFYAYVETVDGDIIESRDTVYISF